ncbi:MAG: PAS domain S-box protein [Phycisphaerae bacterium]|nr:PAS domain S-box protein [Phycisphaerae bacterium]
MSDRKPSNGEAGGSDDASAPGERSAEPRRGRDLFADDECPASRLLNAAPDPVYVLDESGRFVFVNEAAREADGRTLAQWRQLGYLDIVSEDSRDGPLAAAALRAHSEQYRTLVENLDVGLFRTTLDGRILQATPAVAHMLGYDSPDEVKQLDARAAYVDASERETIVSDLLRDGVVTGRQVRLRRRDGKSMWVSLTARLHRDSRGRNEWVDGLVEDITRRKAAEEELRQSRERLQHIIQNTSDIIFQIDTTGTYTFANKAAEEITGYALEEVIGMNMSRLLAPEYVTPIFERLAKRLRGELLEQPFRFETIRKDGRRATLELTTAGIWHGGDLVGVQGVARDVTGRQRAESALRESRRRLRAAHARLVTARDEERRRLASELHDSVGQSIVALQLATENLAEGVAALSAGELSARILGLAAQCGDVVREVRHICYGLHPPALESFGLVAALRQLTRYCLDAGVGAHVRSPAGMVDVRLDAATEIALFRIAQEAVNNALRHSGGENISIELICHEDAIALKIIDDGCGFDPGQVRAGMGLTSMSERAESLGGQLRIESRRGRTEIVARVPKVPLPQDA